MAARFGGTIEERPTVAMQISASAMILVHTGVNTLASQWPRLINGRAGLMRSKYYGSGDRCTRGLPSLPFTVTTVFCWRARVQKTVFGVCGFRRGSEFFGFSFYCWVFFEVKKLFWIFSPTQFYVLTWVIQNFLFTWLCTIA